MEEIKELLEHSMEVFGNTDKITVAISQRLDLEVLKNYIGGDEYAFKNN